MEHVQQEQLSWSTPAKRGALGAMKTLLQSKASPNLIGPDGLSPLHTATTRRDVSAAELLLVYGADPNMPNSFGDAAVHLAAQEDDSDMVGLFMGCGADQTCPGLLRRLSIIQKQPDVCGGSDACEEPLLNKGPQVWLRICHNRADALRRRQMLEERTPKTLQELMEAGFTAQEASCFLESHAKAKEKQGWFRRWDASMPPMVRQTFGILNARVRIPLAATVSTLGVAAGKLPRTFYWERTSILIGYKCVIRIHETHTSASCREGHKLDNEPFDLSVTSFVCTFSEDCVGYCLRVCWFKMIDVVHILECNTAMR